MTNPIPGQQYSTPQGYGAYGARPDEVSHAPQAHPEPPPPPQSQSQSRPQPQIMIPGLSGYSNLELLAHGSTAVVYRAVQDRLKRQVAIKVLLVDDVMTTLENVEFELETLVQLSQMAHIVSIIDTGFTDTDQPFIVMEYCEGGSYAQILKERGPLPIEDVVDVGIKIGEALDAAHAVGIIHRDVKPPNILRSRFGPSLTDFGIAYAGELSRTTTFQKLTPHHASPETLLQQDQSGKSDLYSLASTMWNLLAGAPPFNTPGGNPEDFRKRVLTHPVPRVPRDDVPEWLQQELARAMAKRPAHRHSSALEFSEMLRYRWRNDGQAPISPGVAGERQMYHRPSAAPSSPATPAPPPGPYLPQQSPQLPQPAVAAMPQPPQQLQPSQQPYPVVPAYESDEDDENVLHRVWGWLRANPLALIAGVGVLVLLLGTITVFALSGNGEKDPEDEKSDKPSTSAKPSGDPVPLTDLKPRDVEIAADAGASVELSWTTPRRGEVTSYLVYSAENGGSSHPIKTVRGEVTQANLLELNPDVSYCFTVIALFDTEKNPNLTKRVQADPVCTAR